MSQRNVHRLDVSRVSHQREFVTSDAKTTIISGSLGAGKTTPLCIKAFQECLRAPGAKVGLFRKQLSDFKASTLNTLLQGDREMPPVIPPEYIISHNKSEKQIKIKTGAEPSYIVYSGVSKSKGDKYPKKLGSTEFTDIGLDELEEFNEADFDYLKGRLRRAKLDKEGNKLKRQIFAATNPGGPNHWAYRRFINPENRPDSVKVIRAKTEDNVYLDDDYVQDLKETYTGMMRQRLLLGKWVAAEGQVYQNYDREVHLKEPSYFLKPEEDWENEGEPELRDYNKIIVGADSNYAKPRAAVIIGITGTETHLLDEFYRERVDVDALVSWLDRRMESSLFRGQRVDRVWYDPSEPGEIDQLKSAGYPAKGAPNSIVEGISQVASRIGNEYLCDECGENFSMEKPAKDHCETGEAEYVKPRLFLHPNMTNWRKEVASYKYSDSGRRSDEKPIDENDHLMDATRYGVMGDESGGAGLAFTKV